MLYLKIQVNITHGRKKVKASFYKKPYKNSIFQLISNNGDMAALHVCLGSKHYSGPTSECQPCLKNFGAPKEGAPKLVSERLAIRGRKEFPK